MAGTDDPRDLERIMVYDEIIDRAASAQINRICIEYGRLYSRLVNLSSAMRIRVAKSQKALQKQNRKIQRLMNQNLTVIKVDTEEGYLLIKGNVPGPRKGLVTIKTTVKPVKSVKVEELISYKGASVVEELEKVNEEINKELAEEAAEKAAADAAKKKAASDARKGK